MRAALDAPKKVPSEAVDQATRAAWSTAGLRRHSPRLPFVLGSLCDIGFGVNSSKPYQGLPASTTFLQRERVALGTLFFPPPVLRLSGDAGEILGKLAWDTLGQSKAEWEYVPILHGAYWESPCLPFFAGLQAARKNCKTCWGQGTRIVSSTSSKISMSQRCPAQCRP